MYCRPIAATPNSRITIATRWGYSVARFFLMKPAILDKVGDISKYSSSDQLAILQPIMQGNLPIPQESFEHTDAAYLGYPKTIGWIDDIPIFHRLVSLSLSDNCLDQFPLSLCSITSLQELDISCNRIKVLPQDVQMMTR